MYILKVEKEITSGQSVFSADHLETSTILDQRI